jgi:drug/metabolite transporter (DMT)-like permease
MKAMIKMMCTGPDGETFDPARVIGYGTAVAGVVVFLFNSIWQVMHTHAFDPQNYGAGFAAVCGGVMMVGIGVAAKAHTEPQP